MPAARFCVPGEHRGPAARGYSIIGRTVGYSPPFRHPAPGPCLRPKPSWLRYRRNMYAKRGAVHAMTRGVDGELHVACVELQTRRATDINPAGEILQTGFRDRWMGGLGLCEYAFQTSKPSPHLDTCSGKHDRGGGSSERRPA